MRSFFYFIPGATAVTPAVAAAAGLGHAITAGQALAVRECLAGPDGTRGAVAAAGNRTDDARVGYFPREQTWRKMPGGQTWLGWYTAELPSPADLARAEQLGGHWVKLLDGQSWLVPVARSYAEEDGALRWYHNVPQVLALDENGQWSRAGVVARYARLWDLACRWDEVRAAAADEADSEGRATITFQDLVGGAVEVLAANYAIGPAEAAALEILSEPVCVAILDAVVDLPTRVAWVKKNLPGGGGTSS
jgi:hypothetical protein